MPGPSLGVSFAPTAQAEEEARRRGGAEGPFGSGAGAGSQSAVKVVRLSLPRVLGSRAPAAAALIQPSPAHSLGGGVGSPDSAVLSSILRSVAGPGFTLPGAPVPEDTRRRVVFGGDSPSSESAAIASRLPELNAPTPLPRLDFKGDPGGGGTPPGPSIPEPSSPGPFPSTPSIYDNVGPTAAEDPSNPDTWLSPWERIHGRYNP